MRSSKTYNALITAIQFWSLPRPRTHIPTNAQPNIRFPCFHWNFLLTIYTCNNHILLISKPWRPSKTLKHFCTTIQPWRSQLRTKILQISWPISGFTQFIWRFFWETKLSSTFLKFSFFSGTLLDGGCWLMEVWVWRFQIVRFCWWVSDLGFGFGRSDLWFGGFRSNFGGGFCVWFLWFNTSASQFCFH